MCAQSHLISDEILVKNILNGNVQDFAHVVKKTEKLVTQIVCRLTDNKDDQKDLIQEVYLKAYKNLASFQFKAKLSTWIANIAFNTTVNFLKKQKIHIVDSESSLEHRWITAENPESISMKTELEEGLHLQINLLPPLYKTLITLYHLEELSNKEIAAITNLPEGTIKSYLARARKLLKDALLESYNTQ